LAPIHPAFYSENSILVRTKRKLPDALSGAPGKVECTHVSCLSARKNLTKNAGPDLADGV
jgi:hypothetical protein